MHRGTSLSTFMIHEFDLGGSRIAGFELVKEWIKNILAEFSMEVDSPGALVYFVGDRLAAKIAPSEKVLAILYSLLKATGEELAIARGLEPEELQEIVDALADVFMMEVKLLAELKSHQRHFHRERVRVSPSKMADKHHKHPHLEQELQGFIKKLKTDDKNYSILIGS